MSVLLVTGNTGNGKTLYVVAELLIPFINQGRPLYVAGLDGLKLPYNKLPPLSEWTELRPMSDMPGVEAPFFTFPKGAVIVIDECQGLFPTRSTNSKVPAHIEAFTTHRKTGIDFVLITQRPKQVDSFVMGIVSEHRHLRRIWGLSKAVIYTWDQVSLTQKNYKEALRTVWNYKKWAYGLYVSAQSHTKPLGKIPFTAYLIPVLLVFGLVAAYLFYQSMGEKTGRATPSPNVPDSPLLPGATYAPGQPAPSEQWAPVNYYPADVTRPESAPAYVGLAQPVVAPLVSACVASRSRCQCYSQQATRLDVPDDFCREFAAVGRFDPYRQVVQAMPQSQPAPVEQPVKDDPRQDHPPGMVPLSLASAAERIDISVQR